MQAPQKLVQEIEESNHSGLCPVCHSLMPPGAKSRLMVMLELAYESGLSHGRTKARWLDLLAGSGIASLVWAGIWLLAVRL